MIFRDCNFSANGYPLLFFKFAEENEGSSRKRLTTPGVIALWITCVGILLSLGATIMKDILDSRKEAKLANEHERMYSEGKRMHAEVKLPSEVFENIELRCEFSDQIDWQDEGFLNRRLVEGMGGSLLREDSRTGSLGPLKVTRKER